MKNTPPKKGARNASIDINSFLVLGVVLVAAAAILGAVVPGFPKAVGNIMYLIGALALVLYMWEIQYRRRTGDYHDEGTGKSSKKGKKTK
jgi:membrane protein implicated in regulation of membrane protease activity